MNYKINLGALLRRRWGFPEPKFDPNTLRQYEKVLFANENHKWNCGIVSHIEGLRIYLVTGGYVYNCIPYNEDTMNLVGTREEPPKYYRYWEK